MNNEVFGITFPDRQLANQFIYKMESDRQERALYGGRNSNEFTTKSSVTIKYGQANSNASH